MGFLENIILYLTGCSLRRLNIYFIIKNSILFILDYYILILNYSCDEIIFEDNSITFYRAIFVLMIINTTGIFGVNLRFCDEIEENKEVLISKINQAKGLDLRNELSGCAEIKRKVIFYTRILSRSLFEIKEFKNSTQWLTNTCFGATIISTIINTMLFFKSSNSCKLFSFKLTSLLIDCIFFIVSSIDIFLDADGTEMDRGYPIFGRLLIVYIIMLISPLLVFFNSLALIPLIISMLLKNRKHVPGEINNTQGIQGN